MSFLRKQFAFWRIFLYFLVFTAVYAKLVFQFLFSNFSLPTGIAEGVSSIGVLFAHQMLMPKRYKALLKTAKAILI